MTLDLTQEELTILLDIVATHDNIGDIGERIWHRLMALDMAGPDTCPICGDWPVEDGAHDCPLAAQP